MSWSNLRWAHVLGTPHQHPGEVVWVGEHQRDHTSASPHADVQRQALAGQGFCMGSCGFGRHYASRSRSNVPLQMPNKPRQDQQPQSHQRHVGASGWLRDMLKCDQCCTGKISSNTVRTLNEAYSGYHLLLIFHDPLGKPIPYLLDICGLHVIVETKLHEMNKVHKVLVVPGILKAVSE